MKKTEMRPYKKTLLALRAKIRGDVNSMADAALNGGSNNELSTLPSHLADLGSDTFEQHNTLRLMDNEGEVLQEIETALERIQEGTYGTCAECECRIPKMRLNVIPYTVHCVKCASKLQEQNY